MESTQCTQSTQSTQSSYKSPVTSYKLQVTNKDKEIQSLASLFFVAAWRGIFQDLQEIVLKKICYNIFLLLCCMYSPGYQSLFTLILPTGYVYSYPTYHLGINISWGEDTIAPLYTPNTNLSSGGI